MKVTLKALICAILSVSVCSQPSSVWDKLSSRTGWVLLGDINVAQQSWATARRYRIVKRSSSNNTIIPKIGDQLEITMKTRLIILGFEKNGEVNAHLSPASHQIAKGDSVGFIEAGSLVQVKDVRRESAVGNLQGIWARVCLVE
jgi:hypothetical protein